MHVNELTKNLNKMFKLSAIELMNLKWFAFKKS